MALIERCHGLCTITDGFENARYLGVVQRSYSSRDTETRQQGIGEYKARFLQRVTDFVDSTAPSPINLGRYATRGDD